MPRLLHPARRAAKRLYVKPSAALNNDINVTPLVDVVLVLLIIFMVVTPLLERQVSVQVPSSAVMPTGEPLPDQVIVTVGVSPGFAIDQQIALDDEEYVDRLRRRLQLQSERVVFFMADDQASYQKLIAAMDGAKRAGAAKLAFVADRK